MLWKLYVQITYEKYYVTFFNTKSLFQQGTMYPILKSFFFKTK